MKGKDQLESLLNDRFDRAKKQMRERLKHDTGMTDEQVDAWLSNMMRPTVAEVRPTDKGIVADS